MKVNITYKVNLDEIPLAVGDLIHKTQTQLMDIICPGLSDISLLIREKNDIALALQKLDELRQKLASLDQDLEDQGLMIAQYQKTVAELYLAEHEDISSPQPQLPTKEEMVHIREDMKKEIEELDA